MTADPGDLGPESVEREGTTSSPGNPWRITMSTMLVAVLASAAGAAMAARTYRLFGRSDPGIDISALLLIAVVLTAVAIGLVRRISAVGVLLQITVCCIFITGIVEVSEIVPRFLRYALQVWFALMVVLPLALRRIAAPDPRGKPHRPRLLVFSEFLLTCGAILLLVWLGMLIQFIFLEIA